MPLPSWWQISSFLWRSVLHKQNIVLNHFLRYNEARGTAQTIFAERNDFACLGWNVELTKRAGTGPGESDFKDSGRDPTSTDEECEIKTDAPVLAV